MQQEKRHFWEDSMSSSGEEEHFVENGGVFEQKVSFQLKPLCSVTVLTKKVKLVTHNNGFN